MQKQTHTTGKSNNFLKKNTMEKTFTQQTESVYKVRAILDRKICKLYDKLSENTLEMRAWCLDALNEEVQAKEMDRLQNKAKEIKNKIDHYQKLYHQLGGLLMEMHALGE